MTLWLSLGGLTVLFSLLYGPVLWELFQVWQRDPNYSHGLLIIPIFAYLLWIRREELRFAPPSRWGIVVLLGGLLLLLIGFLVETVGAGYSGLFVSGVSLIGALAGVTLMLGGWALLRELALPLAYLIFMVPLPGAIFNMVTLPLQSFATGMAISVMSRMGIPVLREGNVIVLPNMRLGVVEACSGIRSLFSLLALAAAVALVLMPSTPRWAKLLLVASAVPIAILTNSLRVTGTGILAHWWGPQVAQGFYHDFSGWIIFLVAFVLLAGENLLLHKLSMPDSPASETEPDAL